MINTLRLTHHMLTVTVWPWVTNWKGRGRKQSKPKSR